jgi:hypothetical protein
MQISLSTVRVQIRCKPDHATAGIGDCGSIRKRENNILKKHYRFIISGRRPDCL